VTLTVTQPHAGTGERLAVLVPDLADDLAYGLRLVRTAHRDVLLLPGRVVADPRGDLDLDRPGLAGPDLRRGQLGGEFPAL
jgi:hypothetical protein